MAVTAEPNTSTHAPPTQTALTGACSSPPRCCPRGPHRAASAQWLKWQLWTKTSRWGKAPHEPSYPAAPGSSPPVLRSNGKAAICCSRAGPSPGHLPVCLPPCLSVSKFCLSLGIGGSCGTNSRAGGCQEAPPASSSLGICHRSGGHRVPSGVLCGAGDPVAGAPGQGQPAWE